ncbi:MAG: lipid A biosynthesis acyltransferase [Flavobacteriia bacterium]|nr:lipid A biosynthesis acyltransferase [Flavobacteriia bacterium]
MRKWDGKSKGTVLGYRFFIFSIQIFGLRATYFFASIVSRYFFLFAKKQKNALLDFYVKGFQYTLPLAQKTTRQCFNLFAQTLIDRFAFFTSYKKKFSYDFENETVLHQLSEEKKGGVLISGHIGNWETAANLLNDRVTDTINVLMLDEEVEKIKSFLQLKTGGPKFNLIAVKNDLSHVILVHKALKKGELVAMHADRPIRDNKNFVLTFLNKKIHIPSGPFILAHKFKVPVSFVFAVKEKKFHYHLTATNPVISSLSELDLAKEYVVQLEKMVKKYPNQWYNFFPYFVD